MSELETPPSATPPQTPLGDAIQVQEGAVTSGVYPKRPLAIVRGQGARLWDADGNEFVDCMGGQGAMNVGHCHPKVTAAIAAQAQQLMLCPEALYNDVRARFSEKLVSLAPAGIERVFLCNSGAEAVEGALKFARLATGRSQFVAAMRGFHGRTMGALSATFEKKYRGPFEPLIPGGSHVPYGNLDKLAEAVTDQTAAVILEAVQGEGGVRPGSAEFLQGAQALCRERGAMFVLDEVQTGIARTGRMFAAEHFGLEPDLVSLAKSLGGGLPLGAVLIGQRVAPTIKPMSHGSTFGGNPLACAAGLAVLELIEEEGLCQRAEELGQFLREGLQALSSPKIREVRGLGLLVGAELKQKVTPVLRALQGRGVLALPAGGTVLRFLPPLVIEQDDLARVLEIVGEVLA